MQILKAAILSLLAFSLYLTPCADELFCPGGERAEAVAHLAEDTQVEASCHHSGEEESDGNHCSPSCHCACCASVAEVPALVLLQPPVHGLGYAFIPYLQYLPGPRPANIWHPPQLA